MKHSRNTMQKIWDLKILDVADKLHIKYAQRGAFRKCRCFMHDDKNPSMWFKLSNNTWSCPVCGKGGGLVSLVQEHENLSFNDAVDWLIREFNIYCYDDDEPYRPLKSSTRKTNSKMKPTIPMAPSAQESADNTIPTLESDLLQTCFSTKSIFCRSLVSNSILTEVQMHEAARKYHLGATRDGGVIFWQIDSEQRVHEGKIMFYGPDCHRDHNHDPSTVSTRLIRKGKLTKDWTARHCLFGLHLIDENENENVNENENSIIAIVESEKTAVICSELIPSLPQLAYPSPPLNGEAGRGPSPVIWLATGGLSFLSTDILAPLKGRKVIIFPDTDPDGKAFSLWTDKANEASKLLSTPFPVSDILERHATEDQKHQKIDIADFLLFS